MKKFTAILFCFFFATGYSQSSEKEKLNLDFEQIQNGLPARLEVFGSNNYKIYRDSLQVKSGKYSVVIENTGSGSDYKALAINLPDNYAGKVIRLSGYIKTENVTDGYAGLWMRIDPQAGFDNMNGRGAKGTTGWQRYEITLPLQPEKTKAIVVGGMLVGKGKMWLDQLQVTVDGKDLAEAPTYARQLLPAEKDLEFDKGSRVTFLALNQQLTDNLELLGKIWGFLKYHHPAIAKGNYQWDYELFRFLPSYLAARNHEDRDRLLITWIEKYGSLPACTKCSPAPKNAVLTPDHSWISSTGISAPLQTLLNRVYSHRNQGGNYYIGLHPNVQNPDFTNEKSYEDMSYPDEGFRLLTLYRYWNMIAYFFPNKHLTDKKWDTVLREYIPVFLNAKNELEYELAAVQLIGEINDTHANLWGGGNKVSELKGKYYAPFKVEFIEDKVVVTDFYNPELSSNDPLKVGDIITHIRGKAVETIIDSVKSYYPSSNRAAMLRDISEDLLRSSKDTLRVKYLSEGRAKEKDVVLYEADRLNKYHWYKVSKEEKCFKFLDGNIGYITLANISAEDIPEIKKQFKNTKGIIIDIRNYPSAFVPFALGSYFTDRPADFVKFTCGNPDNPGEFTFREGAKITPDKNTYKGKLVVLVNEKSQSQAEYTAMAFRSAKNSLIIGSTTAGADGNVSTIVLPGGLTTMISGIGVYYPDGTETQRVGIVPDVVVRPTIEGIKNEKDEVLQKAVDLIRE